MGWYLICKKLLNTSAEDDDCFCLFGHFLVHNKFGFQRSSNSIRGGAIACGSSMSMSSTASAWLLSFAAAGGLSVWAGNQSNSRVPCSTNFLKSSMQFTEWDRLAFRLRYAAAGGNAAKSSLFEFKSLRFRSSSPSMNCWNVVSRELVFLRIGLTRRYPLRPSSQFSKNSTRMSSIRLSSNAKNPNDDGASAPSAFPAFANDSRLLMMLLSANSFRVTKASVRIRGGKIQIVGLIF